MKKLVIFTLFAVGLSFFTGQAFTQVVVSESASPTPDGSAILDVQSTSKGFLFPRMSQSDRNGISNPATGLIIFQTDITPGFYYNTGTPSSVNWERITDASTIGGYWSPSGSDIYFDAGNVGVGESSPQRQFHVNGASMFVNDSVYITGRPGKIFLNAESGYDPAIRFGYAGSAMFKLYISGASTTNPYFAIGSDISYHIWGMRPTGRVYHDYQGTSAAAYVLKSGAPRASLAIENTANTIRNISYGIQVSLPYIPTTGLDTVPAGITSFIEGDGTAIFGMNDNYENSGWIGTEHHGVSGKHGSTENRGTLGLSTSGVQGTNNTSEFWGALGLSSSGVYGRLSANGSSQTLSANDFAVKGVGVETSGGSPSYNRGNNYVNQVGGLMGYNNVGTQYSAGVWGFTDQSSTDNRTSGVFGGIENSGTWGALGYENSSSVIYGGYFTTQTTGSGKAMGNASSSIGVGVYGDLFGAHIDGEVYGLYAKGNKYGLYSEGDMYRTGADVHIQKDNSGQNNVMYTLVSPEMTIQTYGVGQMNGGKASISFDDAFANIVSDDEPIIVTITPIGESEGVHLSSVDSKGFSALENRDGKSSVQFMWVAIGKRKGYENMSLPADVIADDYDQKISDGLHNDADMTTDGKGLYYNNGTLNVGDPTPYKSSSTENEFQDVKLESESHINKEVKMKKSDDKK